MSSAAPQVSPLPIGWARSTLGELGEYVNGRAFKPSEWGDRGRRIIRIQDLTGGRYEAHFYDGEADSRHIVHRGDFLISWAATLGAYIWDGPEAVLNQHIFKVNTSIDKNFHYYLAISVVGELYRRSHGSGMVHVTRGPFLSTQVSLPPLNEQHRIVKAIETRFARLDTTVRALRRARVNLKRYHAGTLRTAFQGELFETRTGAGRYSESSSQFQPSPTNWTISRLSELTTRIQYGYTASSAETETGPRFLRITDIQDGTVKWDEVPGCAISEEAEEKYRLKDGDLVFARTGATVGKSLLLQNPPRAIFASYLIRVTINERVLPKYLAYFFQSPSYWSQIHEGEVGIGQPNVNGTTLGGLLVPLAPLPVQRQIVDALDTRLSRASEVSNEVEHGLERCSRLRESILKAAFEGRLVPQDPNDEPASALLERIKRDIQRVSVPVQRGQRVLRAR